MMGLKRIDGWPWTTSPFSEALSYARTHHHLPTKREFATLIADGMETADRRIRTGAVANTAVNDIGTVARLITSVHGYNTFAECHVEKVPSGIDDIAAGVSVYHSFRIEQHPEAPRGVVAFKLSDVAEEVQPSMFQYN